MLGIETRELVSPTEELGANEKLHHGVREEEDHDQVHDRCHTQGEGEALNTTDSEDVENNSCNKVDRIGDQNGSLRTIPAFINRGTEWTSIADFISDTFEVDDKGVRSNTDRNDQARNASK